MAYSQGTDGRITCSVASRIQPRPYRNSSLIPGGTYFLFATVFGLGVEVTLMPMQQVPEILDTCSL